MHDVLLALPFGVAIGLALGLVGGGGSILAVPVLVYVLGEPVKEATTASLAIVGTTALVGAADHARVGSVRGRIAAVFGFGGACGAVAGTVLNRLTDAHVLLLAFAVVMLGSAYAMVRGRAVGPRDEPPANVRTLAVRILPVGVGVGVLTGFFGVGGGFLIVPAFVLLLGLSMPLAIGTSLLVIALTSVSALAAHLASGSVDWAVVIAFTAAAIVGALAGSAAGRHLSGARLTQVFAAMIVAVACFLIAKNLAAVA
ncbi:MAG TPA: sulfite exporter TauE/SafE family protein [Gaiellaceae bacterium]